MSSVPKDSDAFYSLRDPAEVHILIYPLERKIWKKCNCFSAFLQFLDDAFMIIVKCHDLSMKCCSNLGDGIPEDIGSMEGGIQLSRREEQRFC